MTEISKYDNADYRTDEEDAYDNYRGDETYPDGSLKCECWRLPRQPRIDNADHHRERSREC